jgi:tetratricopeptide (TPR) repeat protein
MTKGIKKFRFYWFSLFILYPSSGWSQSEGEYLSRAKQHHKNGKFKTSIQVSTAGIEIYSNSHKLYETRCHSLLMDKQYYKALNDCNKSIGLALTAPQAYETRGAVYTALERHLLAEQDFKTACRLGHTEACKYKKTGLISEFKKIQREIRSETATIESDFLKRCGISLKEGCRKMAHFLKNLKTLKAISKKFKEVSALCTPSDREACHQVDTLRPQLKASALGITQQKARLLAQVENKTECLPTPEICEEIDDIKQYIAPEY